MNSDITQTTLHHIDIHLPIAIDQCYITDYITSQFEVEVTILFGDPDTFIKVVGPSEQKVNRAALAIQKKIIDTLVENEKELSSKVNIGRK
jgi:hypothetical protein